MKNLADKLKNLDYKQFAIAHAEKVGAGIIALLIVFALFTSRWKPYQRTPQELVKLAEEAKTKIESASWPEEKRQEHQTVNYLTDQEKGVRRLHTPIEVAAYAYSTEMSWPLYRKKKRITEPVYRPVQDVLADSSRVILSQQDPELDESTTSLDDSASADEESVPDEFSRRGGGANGPGSNNTAQLDAGSNPDAIMQLLWELSGNIGDFTDTSGGYGGLATYGTIGRGMRYVAVRGVIDLWAQKEEFAKATGENASQLESELVDVVDFKIQRLTATTGSDPWGGVWQDIDLEVALETLEVASGWDPDPVDVGVTDPVVTMPLPSRVVGYWTKNASHPRLENFELSQDELKREVQINQKLLEQYKKQESQLPPPLVQKNGFSSQVNDLRAIRQKMVGDGKDKINVSQLVTEVIRGDKKANDPEQKKKIEQAIKERVAAAGRLLLFRYLDFSVEPGNAYRYRVKLVYRNPFYHSAPSRLADPIVGEGQTRESEWSNPTAPTAVSEDISYYLTKTNSRGRDDVQMEMFQWNADTGTTVHHQTWMKRGDFVGGRASTDLLRPTELTFKIESVDFVSDDLLVDAEKAPQSIDTKAHPDLKGADFRDGFGIVDRAVIMNEYGELTPLDSAAQEQSRLRAEDRLQRERQDWEYLKTQDEKTTTDPSLLGGGFGSLMQDPEKAKKAGKLIRDSKKSPNRKSK